MKKITLLLIFILLTALGFSQTHTTVLYENFNGNFIPGGWTISHAQGTVDFIFGSGDNPGSSTDFSTNAATFDDDAAGNGQHNVVYLASPYVDLTNFESSVFEFDYALTIDGNGEYLEAKISDGTNYFTVVHYDADTDPITSASFDIREMALNHSIDISHIQVYFKYDDNNSWGYGCGIDNVYIAGLSPVNDNCNNAIVLTVGHNFLENDTIANNLGTTASGETPIPSCGNFGSGKDVWFRAVVPASGNLKIETKEVAGSSFEDTVVTAYSGSCGNLTEIGCDDTSGDGFYSLLALNNLTPGDNILIRVFEYGNNTQGEFKIAVYDDTPPANDDCANATLINNFYYTSYTASVDANNATNNGGFIAPSGCGAGMNDGVWYTFTAQHSGEITVNVANPLGFDGAGWDPEIGIYTGSCSSFTCVDNTDNGGTGVSETITFSAILGTTYYINIGQYSSGTNNSEGYFDLEVSYNCGGTPPTNDVCGTAWNISSIFTTGPHTNAEDATCATGGIIDVCSSDGMNDGVWFKLTATDNGEVEIIVDPDSSWDAQIGVYSGACGTLNCEATVDNAWNNDDPETITFNVTSGETYFVNVGHWDSANDLLEGFFTINAQFTSSTAAILNETISGLEIYPNPVTDLININAQNNINKITIFNQIGQLVKVLTPNKNSIQTDLGDLTSGIYILKIESENKIATQKIVKK